MTEDKLNYILKPLGMHVEFSSYVWKPWCIFTDAKAKTAIYGKFDKSSVARYKMEAFTCNNMFELICNIEVFVVVDPCAFHENAKLNPYFGCKSYEEALIKKDLFNDDGNQ